MFILMHVEKVEDSLSEEATIKKHKDSSCSNEIIKLSELVAEASFLIRMYMLHEAEVLYTEALKLQPQNLHLYLCRSRCRVDNEKYLLAIEDIDTILIVTPTNAAAILIKANAYYHIGDFEKALLWYHNGLKVKPLQDFQTGIGRAQTAIIKTIDLFDKEKIARMIKYEQNLKKKGRSKEHEIPVFKNEKTITKIANLEHNLLEELHEVTHYLSLGLPFFELVKNRVDTTNK
jgi:tetratricopeptide (TPR) repeat protein